MVVHERPTGRPSAPTGGGLMVVETTAGGVALLAGRLLFGGVLAFMGLNHFLQADGMASYAEGMGVPAARASVLASGLVLVFGGLSLVLGAYPVLGGLAVLAFLAITTPTMHRFWAVEDPRQQQTEMTQFLKNVALAGGALVLFAIGESSWPLALDLGL